MNPFDKLSIARITLHLKQKEAAEQSGLKESVIKTLESGGKKFIPNEYLAFLYEKGIDLNWIFDEEDKRHFPVFRENDTHEDEDLKLVLTTILVKLNTFEQIIACKYKQEFGDACKEIINDIKKIDQHAGNS